jgi:sensor histidine kinase YesM
LVTLSEELEFTRSYLFLHEVRLGNCLHCEYDIPADSKDSLLPPLILQLLVENVIKHNSITQSNPIHPKKTTASSGVGLQNLAKRCQLMSGGDILIERHTEIFTVKVPLLYE